MRQGRIDGFNRKYYICVKDKYGRNQPIVMKTFF